MSEKRTGISDEILKTIIEKIESIEFGSVTVTVQDGRVVQLETNEKTRFKK